LITRTQAKDIYTKHVTGNRLGVLDCGWDVIDQIFDDFEKPDTTKEIFTQRQTYSMLFNYKYIELINKGFICMDVIRRRSNIYAVQNTVREWRGQFENSLS